MHRRVAPLSAVVLVGAAIAAACGEPPPVDWDDARRVSGAIAPGAQLVLDDAGVPAVTQAWVPLRWPSDSAACAGTFAAARGRGDTAYAAWWRTNSYGHGDLMLARSDDGVHWGEPALLGGAVRTDPLCVRPAPAITVDLQTGAVFMVWHGMTNFGPGMIFAQTAMAGRQMIAFRLDSAEAVHTASIAASGDTVAVALEAPTASGSEVRLALSLLKDHIPLTRGLVSPPGARAFAPVVALRGGRVAVAWNEGRSGDSPPAAAARVGTIIR